MGHAELYFRERPEAWKVCLRPFERTWKSDTRATENILQMTLGNDQSCLTQFECPEMRGVPPAVIVKGQCNPACDPPRRASVEPIKTTITRKMRITTANFHALGDAINGHARSNNRNLHRFFIVCLSLGPSGLPRE